MRAKTIGLIVVAIGTLVMAVMPGAVAPVDAGQELFSCDFPLPGNPVIMDPCNGGELVLNPVLLGVNQTMFAEGFLLDDSAELCVRLITDQPAPLALLPQIKIDGTVVPPAGGSLPFLMKSESRLSLEAGSHFLSAYLPKPDPTFEFILQVRVATAPTADQVEARLDLVRMQRNACESIRADLLKLLPDEAAALMKRWRRLGHVPGRMQIEYNRYEYPSLLGPVLVNDSWSPPADPVNAAQQWLSLHAPLLGLNQAGCTLELIGAETAGDKTVDVRFDQNCRGVPVVSGRVDLRLSSSNRPLMYRGNIVRLGGISTQATIDPKQAIETAADGVPSGKHTPSAELVILDLSDLEPLPRAVLAWRVRFHAHDGGPNAVGHVDANTGELLHAGVDALDFDAHLTRINESECVVDGEDDESELIVDTEVVYNDGSLPPDLGCSSDRECLTWLSEIATLDDFFRRNGRDGWSGEGWVGNIPADDVYRIRYGSRSFSSYYRDRIGGEPRAVTLNHNAGYSTMAHEFGHAMLEVEVEPSTSMSLLSPYFTIQEHAADVVAILSSPAGDDSRFLLGFADPSLPPIRDHTSMGCTGYGRDDTCDTNLFDLEWICGVITDLRLGCLEYTHMSAYQWNGGESHLNSCVYTKPAFLLRREDPRDDGLVFEGLNTHTLPPELVERFYMNLMTEELTGDERPMTYAEAYRRSALTIADSCDAGGAGCDPAVDEAARLADALDATGFLSAKNTIAHVRPEQDETAMVSTPNGVYLYYVGEFNQLMELEIADPASSVDAAPREVAREWGDLVQTLRPPSAILVDSTLYLAYAELAHGDLRVIRRDLDASIWESVETPDTLPLAASPSLAVTTISPGPPVEYEIHVAFVEVMIRQAKHLILGRDEAVVAPGRWVSAVELLATPESLYLFTNEQTLMLPIPGSDDPPDMIGMVRIQELEPGGWTTRRTVEHMAPYHGFDPTFGTPNVVSRDDGGISAAVHSSSAYISYVDRVYDSHDGFEFFIVRLLRFKLDSDGRLDLGSAAREEELTWASVGPAALTSYDHPDLGRMLVVATVPGGGLEPPSVELRHRRSD